MDSHERVGETLLMKKKGGVGKKKNMLQNQHIFPRVERTRGLERAGMQAVSLIRGKNDDLVLSREFPSPISKKRREEKLLTWRERRRKGLEISKSDLVREYAEGTSILIDKEER